MANNTVQTLDRALDIIELLSLEKEGLGVTEIGERAGLHKSTVHRLLNSLAERGYIEKQLKSDSYKLGLKFIEVSSLFLNHLELKTEALPYLRTLAGKTGQPVHLAILRDDEAVYIEKVDVRNSIRMYSQIGRRVPLHCSAIGKCLVFGLSKKETNNIIDKMVFKKYTGNTILDKSKYINELSFVAENGWAADNEEHEKNIRCIAAPVYDYTGEVIAAVSTSGDKSIISIHKDEQISRAVMETAGDISKRMGYFKIEK